MAHEVITEQLHDSVYPTEHYKITKREDNVSKAAVQNFARQKEFINFVEEKLIEHSQALELLVKLINDALSALKNLVENVAKNIQEPRLPDKIEDEPEMQDRSGYGDEFRRSYWGNPLKFPNVSNVKPTSSAWCSVAVLCHRTGMPVCGYDDSYGYGKFDDLCHLIQVNCYWNHNFALVPNCRSST